MKSWHFLVATLIALFAAALVLGCQERESELAAVGTNVPPSSSSSSAQGTGARRQELVGSAVCARCHQAQSAAYLGSHHAKALVATDSSGAKPRFADAHLQSKLGGVTRFSVQSGAPFVTTPVPGGKTATLPVRYVSGVWPLEQYVVETERGKLQSLGVVWDSRDPAEGGARWLHVYGKQGIAPSDPLFFTAPAQSWNHVCADCHSTGVERRYDVQADRFDTRWAELSVGCEACHGPGSEHVRSAQSLAPGSRPAPFANRLKRSEPWMPSATGSPTPRAQSGTEVETCAPCHSRRTPIKEGFIAGAPFLDSFLPDLLRPGRYHADGQVEGEVYEWGSFRQSRMYHAGVQCSDCHDAHSGKPLAQGNALCVRCHEPSRFDVPSHSRHAAKGAQAPRCIDCHMPPQTFMQIDERRDHSLRIPRPDHTELYGTPNACNACHTQKSAAWASAAVAAWAPAALKRPHFVEALGKDRQGALDAPRALRDLALDPQAPAIARATALERLGAYATERSRQALQTALTSADALVVYGAVLGVAQLPPPQRSGLLAPVLVHPIRAVRVAAGKAMASAPLTALPAAAQSALEKAFAEVEQSFDVSASQPPTHVEQSAFELARGRRAEAEASLRRALRLEPCLPEAHLNLADLERQRGDEVAAERAIRAALACNPRYAAAHHALGLWQARSHQLQAAQLSLKKASDLAPTETRFSYVLAVAQASSGNHAEAIRTLEAALERRPNDQSALQALAGYLREAGQIARAAEVRRKLEVLLRE